MPGWLGVGEGNFELGDGFAVECALEVGFETRSDAGEHFGDGAAEVAGDGDVVESRPGAC